MAMDISSLITTIEEKLSSIKANMVTKSEFAKVAASVDRLESGEYRSEEIVDLAGELASVDSDLQFRLKELETKVEKILKLLKARG